MRKTINQQNLIHNELIKIENFKKVFYSFFTQKWDNVEAIYEQLLPLITVTEIFQDKE